MRQPSAPEHAALSGDTPAALSGGTPAAPSGNAPADLPHWPRGWYVVARAADLRPGAVRQGQLGPLPYVLYRGHDGQPRAMHAFCPHMGAHLRTARVVGDGLQCALHHRVVRPLAEPLPPGTTPCALHQPAWPCEERLGLIFLHPPGEAPAPLLPTLADDCGWLPAAPLVIRADWRAMICNGFDIAHLRAVHQRELVGEPLFERLPTGGLRMSYQTRVLPGGGPASWLMNQLAGSGEGARTLRLRHTCHGTSMLVECQLGRFASKAVFGVLPQDAPDSAADAAPEQRRTRAFASIGLPRGGALHSLRLRLARHLYLAFLRKDFGVVEGMRLRLGGVDDPGVQAVAAYLSSLPPIARAPDHAD
ncbi:MAG: Rieske 2Fe-2S domain-containing protein [Pseudomonadota bacterium]|nr:Rieske 2Fe-2S domain-containing protein [Pseudomonadota bacterium]